MIINYRKPWNIEQNRLYELSDIMSGPSMQNDFTFYMRMKLLRDPSDTYNKGIFVRPGMHYGLFAKLNGGCFSWDWWTQEEGKDHPTFWTMTTDHLGQAIWDEITFIVTHYAEQKKFELYIRNEYTGDTIRRNQTYKGEMHDYTSAPFHFGFCNYYEGIIPDPEHIGFCSYDLKECGLFSEVHKDHKVLDMLEKNKKCRRVPMKMLKNPVFVMNPREHTKYKVWDLSGNSMHLEYNLVVNERIKLL